MGYEMTMPTKNTETDAEAIHALTRAEIGRQIKIHAARRAEIILERAELYGRHGPAMGASPAISDDEKASREHARSLLNGHAPESLSDAPALSRDRILTREQRALDLVLKILNNEEVEARAAEAVLWSEKNADRWRILCREIILVAIRLDALECSARELLDQCVDPFAVRLPLANVIGGRPISETSLSELTETALREGVITAAERRKASST
jgi:hypothetical protein